MDCKDVQERIEELVHGFVPAAEEEALRTHFLACKLCAQRYQWVEKLALEIAGKATNHPLPEELRRSIEKDLMRTASRRSWLRPAVWVPAAALAVVILALTVLFGRPERRSIQVNQVIQAVVRDYQGQWFNSRLGDPHWVGADLQRWLDKAMDLEKKLPFQGNDEFVLLGARKVEVSGRQGALLVYRREEAVIGFFILPAKGINFPVQPDGRRRVLAEQTGYVSLTWPWDSYVCSLVSTQKNREQVVALWERMRSRPPSG